MWFYKMFLFLWFSWTELDSGLSTTCRVHGEEVGGREFLVTSFLVFSLLHFPIGPS